MTAKMSAHRWQLHMRIGDGDDTASCEIVTRQEAVAVRRDAARQPAVANKEEVSRMDVCGGCATKGDARQRHATTGNATTSLHTRGKWEERSQQTRGDGALIGQGCVFRGGGRVERMRGGGINNNQPENERLLRRRHKGKEHGRRRHYWGIGDGEQDD